MSTRGSALATQQTMPAAGVLYVIICLATLGSRLVRDLQRAGQTYFRAP